VKEVFGPDRAFAAVLISTLTWPAGNSLLKKSLVTLEKSENLAIEKR